MPPPPEPPVRRRGWRRFLRPGVVLLLLAAAAFRIVRWAETASPSASTREKGKEGPPHVSVSQAHAGDIGVFVNGLGSVVPIYSVNVTSRVEGQLMQVLYKEGQTVHESDPLVEIDPRQF